MNIANIAVPAADNHWMQAFHREVALLRGITHLNVCPILGVDGNTFPGGTCLVLPWMSHGNVLQHLGKHGWFYRDAIRFVRWFR